MFDMHDEGDAVSLIIQLQIVKTLIQNVHKLWAVNMNDWEEKNAEKQQTLCQKITSLVTNGNYKHEKTL